MKELYDKDMREALFSYFEDSMKKVRFIEEINMGKSRADAIMITEDGIIGFEFKSDKDSLARLSRQIVDYDKYYDKNYLVVGKHFEKKAKENIPDYWGIITVYEEESEAAEVKNREDETENRVDNKSENKIVARIIREAGLTPYDNLRRQLAFLWRNELISLVKKYKLGGVSDKNKAKLAAVLYKNIDKAALKSELLNQLFEREYPKVFYYVYSTPIRKITFVTTGYVISRIYLREIKAAGEDEKTVNNMELHKNIKQQMDQYFKGERFEFDLPLEKVRCNAFSRKVYEELKKIPYGETRTYGEIAKAVGKEKAYRAVGNANNKNPFPIIVPCHRVIGANGSLTGYAGGVDFKKMLLSIEKGAVRK